MEITPKYFTAITAPHDLFTGVFCLALLLLTINYTVNRRQYKSVLSALFIPRERNQLLREGKVFNEWVYFFAIIFVFIVQGCFLYFLIWEFLPDIAVKVNPFLLYGISTSAVVVDYFVKMLLVYVLTYVFDCQEARSPFLLNKFFYLNLVSLFLLPLLVLAIYTGNAFLLIPYLLVFLIVYFTMLFRSITLNSKSVSLFHFFLYFCTLEILPYLVWLKLIVIYRNTII